MTFFGHKYRYWFMLLLGGYSFANTLFVEALTYYRLELPAWLALASFVGVVFLVWEGNRLIEKAVPALITRLPVPIHPLALQFVLGMLIVTITVTPLTWLLSTQYLEYSTAELQLALKITLVFAFRINLFLQTINVIFFFMQQFREKQLEAERFRKASAQAQFQSLKNQVNPHFLFNSLNVLSTLVTKDASAASEFIEQLAKVYRHILQQKDKELIDLRSELAFIRSYQYLLDKRFGDTLRLEIDIPEQYQDWHVVPVALQMLIENAIKHNVSSRNRPLTVRVSTNDSPALIVENNLQPKLDKEPSTLVGLDNIAKRYQFVTSQPVEVTQENNTFRVTLPLIQVFPEDISVRLSLTNAKVAGVPDNSPDKPFV